MEKEQVDLEVQTVKNKEENIDGHIYKTNPLRAIKDNCLDCCCGDKKRS